MIHKSITFLIATIFTLGILWAIGFLWFAASTSTMAIPPSSQKTDAIVVLTGAGKRIDTGLRLLKEGAADKLFISGVHKDVRVADLLKGGQAPGGITLGYQATDTKGNADETTQWVVSHNIKSIRVVTSSYHIPRALLELGHQMPGVSILAHPVKTGDEYDLTARPYWSLTFREYNKTLLTWIRQTMSGEQGKETP
jgi:uncharacterized SAM-binding protein YcdF (DUF218 family)